MRDTGPPDVAVHVPSTDDIIEAVATVFGRTPAELLGPDRHAALSWPRQVAMYLLHTEEGGRRRTTEIAKIFQRKSHDCAVDADTKVRRQLAAEGDNGALKTQIATIWQRIRMNLTDRVSRLPPPPGSPTLESGKGEQSKRRRPSKCVRRLELKVARLEGRVQALEAILRDRLAEALPPSARRTTSKKAVGQ